MATYKQRVERTNTLLMLSGAARAKGIEVSQAVISADLDLLHRYEATLRRINENECNGWPREVVERRNGNVYRYNVQDDAWMARDKKREESTIAKVLTIADKYGLALKINDDPRGGAIRFVLPSGASNGWDGETWGIYW